MWSINSYYCQCKMNTYFSKAFMNTYLYKNSMPSTAQVFLDNFCTWRADLIYFHLSIFILYSNPCEILLEFYWMVLYSKHYLSHLSTFLLHLLLQSKWISCLRQWSSSSANFSWIIIWFGTLKSDHGFTIMHFSIPETVDRKDPKGSTYTVRHFLDWIEHA